MTTLDALLDAAPSALSGMSLPHDDWDLVVEMAVPGSASSLWGVAEWGNDVWTTSEWTDITPFVRGMDWQRGIEGYFGRPRVGVARITLDNHEYKFSPTDPTNSYQTLVQTSASTGLGEVVNSTFTPGTVVRISAIDTSDGVSWVPQFTGIVESWPEAQTNLGQDSYVTITAVETLSALATVDEIALSSPVGGNEYAQDRIERLAASAGWAFGYEEETGDNIFGAYGPVGGGEYTLQQTDMANNRLGEIYLTADSVGGVVRSHRNGKLYTYGGLRGLGHPDVGTVVYDITPAGPASASDIYFDVAGLGTGASGSLYVPVDPEGFTWDNDNDPVVNFVQIARKGGTVQEASDAVSIQRLNARRTYARTDLISNSDNLCGYLANDIVAKRADASLRVRDIRVNGYVTPTASIPALITLDVHSDVKVIAGTQAANRVLYTFGKIGSMAHAVLVTGANSPVQWTCTYTLTDQPEGPEYNDIADY